MTNLIALAKKVDGLKGPCRETDAEICLALGIVRERDGDCFYGHRHHPVLVFERDYYDTGSVVELIAPTASLDDARSLVPEGLRLMLSEWDDEPHLRARGAWQAILSKPGCDTSFDAMRGYRCDHAATPALALTAAALRAIAAQKEG
ncbi:hypothetical protein [Sphingomonas sp.]|uniref:hypothetical protein n=1 Tax=Sphingomonas sp. TaxID=28214 RepID=UPI003F72091A